MQKKSRLEFLRLRIRAGVFLTLKGADNTSPCRQQTLNPSPGSKAFADRREAVSFGNGIAAAIPLQRPVLEGTFRCSPRPVEHMKRAHIWRQGLG